MRRFLPFIVVLFLLTPVHASPLEPTGIQQQATQTVAGPAYTVEFGKVETVYSYSSQNCEHWDLPDSEATALIDADGNLQLYAAPVETTRKFIGPNLTDVQHDCHVMMASGKNPDPRAYDGNEWITSPYTLDGTTIYGLIHSEFHGSPSYPCHDIAHPNDELGNCWWNSINLAKSTDRGYSFTHAAAPNQNISNTSINFNGDNTTGMTGIFSPSNIVFKDGYYYSSFFVRLNSNDQRYRTCMARTNNLNDPTSWKFWGGTDFSVPTRGIPASGDCVSPALWIVGNIHWNTYLNQYVSTHVNFTSGSTQDIWINSGSSLGVPAWSSKIVNIPTSVMLPSQANYFTFLQPGAETRNFEDIGRSPWLYYSSCQNGSDCTWANSAQNIGLKRVRVRFNTTADAGKYDVLDLHFNEYKGTKTLDSSFYGNDGTLTGNAALKQEGDTKFVHFGGTGNVTVNPNASLNLNSEITITARVRTAQQPAANTFPGIGVKQDSTNRSYGVFINSAGHLIFDISKGTSHTGSTSNAVINDGKWHDVQVNFADATGTAKIVIDGKLDKTNTQGGKLADSISTGPLMVGTDGFIGDLDHFTVYNFLLPVPTDVAIKPADLNTDGKIDIYDYNLLVANFNKTGSNIVGDIDHNGKVDIYDYNELVANFGK